MINDSDAGIKFVIGGEGFPTKKAVEGRVRGILEETPGGHAVKERDFRFLKGLFGWHPNATNKRVAQTQIIQVVKNERGLGHGFEIARADGSFTDISYRKCLRALTGLDCHKPSVLEAMRYEAAYQIWQFGMTQGELAYDEDYAVDHRYPWTFDRLVKGFLLSEGITFADIELSSEDGQIGAELPEPWRSKWSEYHREHARLRMLPRELNSRIGARDPARSLEDRCAQGSREKARPPAGLAATSKGGGYQTNAATSTEVSSEGS